jgi:hypothetical protein
MAQKGEQEGQGPLEALAAAAQGQKGLPPVHLWNPPLCSDIGLKIARDGSWWHQGAPIARPALVTLFARVLRRDPDGYFLVTPVEKVPIAVEDAPFLAVSMRENAGALLFRTNLDDEVRADADHPLRFEQGEAGGIKPYVRVRADLWALLTRSLAYDLMERAETRQMNGREVMGVSSGGHFFVMEDGRAE